MRASAVGASGERVWLELQTPQEDARVRGPVGLIEVRGFAGTGLRGTHEVIVVLDRSVSTWYPSGVDVDADGRVGELLPGSRAADRHPFWTTDAGDTIFQAELVAARRLFSRMNPETTRMGLVAFGHTADLRAPLGSSPAVLEQALDRLPARGDAEGTHFAAAIRRALDEFERSAAEDPAGGAMRHRSIVFLSDGAPNLPPGGSRGVSNTAFFTRLRAEAARDAGVRMYAFGLGPDAIREPVVFEYITALTGGALFLVDEPGQVIDYLPHVSLTEIRDIRVENRTSGQQARAVRQFPDGSFDAWAPLVPGPNELIVRARAAGGGEQTFARNVWYEPRDPQTPEEISAMRALLEDLRARTLETELAARARRGLERIRRKNLRIEVEPGGSPPAEPPARVPSEPEPERDGAEAP